MKMKMKMKMMMMKQWNRTKKRNNKRKKTDILDKIINKSKLFEEQIELLKKLEGLKGYWPYKDFGDKELTFKYFKIELADTSNEIDQKLFDKYLVIHL